MSDIPKLYEFEQSFYVKVSEYQLLEDDIVEWKQKYLDICEKKDILEAERDGLEDILHSINNWCKAYPKKNFIGKEFDLANHVLNGIQKLIAQKSPEGKDVKHT